MGFLSPFIFRLFLLLSSPDPSAAISIPLGGNAYQTAGNMLEPVSPQGISSWSHIDSEYAVYFYLEKAARVSLALTVQPQQATATLSARVGAKEHEFTLRPGQHTAALGSWDLEQGYQSLQLMAVDREGSHYGHFTDLVITPEEGVNLHYVKDNEANRFYWGRRGPSVHLRYEIPENRSFKWFYNEMTVPEGQDPIGSYFMANGFGQGYFGIQVNSPTERRILFSVWSPYQTDNPNEIPEDERIRMIRKGIDVYTGEFGNEGSGGQSYLRYPWKAGVTYRFLNSVEPDGKGNTIYTAYFYDPEMEEWLLIASFSRPKTDTWYSRPHSFLENFNPLYGHVGRKVLYENQWIGDEHGNWHPIGTATFTGDDIARRAYRLDFAGGAEGQRFFLQNGGFFHPHTEIGTAHTIPLPLKEPQVSMEALP
ncbi:putative protein-signal peptide and transmembrane prediction [Lunatimonas lonarensis]|uniref:DUF5077 domain-containing protein n=1 Tax=Lunatimonas lonarensis TaxID=1232681 RepID=R7ZVE1_9BACT|nr:DUF3472 domain-containing protein [Lunatimonas lonarensis]EON78057.1 putative protein-signal peptide and transmembrane prediction [Lunatimonas lonarensis]